MDEDALDVIVIGGGIAGSVCAYELAKAGKSVVLVERGETAGAKNLSGGVFYSRIMEEIFKDFSESAPIERVITRNCLSFMHPNGAVNLDIFDRRLDPSCNSVPVANSPLNSQMESQNSPNAVSVLRAKLDAWLVEKCEEAGVMFMPGMKVEKLLLDENEKVSGIVAGGDEIPCRVVVCADGINSFTTQGINARPVPKEKHLAVGVKSVIALDEATIRERFHLEGNQGAAYACVGDCTQGVAGGGFLYTNRDSISIGVVLRLDSLKEKGLSSSDVHDHFLTHPAIAPYLVDGKILEYGCHMVAEGGAEMVYGGKLYQDGMIVVGDAAGLTLNTGFTIRGMDLAAMSGKLGAETIVAALESEDYSAQQLSSYQKKLENSFVGKDLETYRHAPAFFDNPRLYENYGQILGDLTYQIFNHDTTPRKPLAKLAWDSVKAAPVSLLTMGADLWKGFRSL